MVAKNLNGIPRRIQLYSETQPDAPAFVLSGRRAITYGILQSLIQEMRAELDRAGFGRSARIVIALPPGPWAALAIAGISCCAVAVPLDPKLTANEIENRFAVLKPDAVLILAGTESPAQSIAERSKTPIIAAIPTNGGAPGLRIAATRAGVPAPAGEPGPDSPAFILQSSGTTADAKLVPFSHSNMLAAAARMQAWFDLTTRDRCLSVSPVHYSHGLKVTVFTPLLTGGSVAFPSDPSHVDFAEWFGALRPTWYSAAPALHRHVLDRTESMDPSGRRHSLRFILSGGAPMPRELHDGLQGAFGIPVVEHYGLTEAAQIAANVPGSSKFGTCGRPWPDTVQIVDEEGRRLPAGEQGEIAVRGPTLTSGYLDLSQRDLSQRDLSGRDEASFSGGCFRTGDVGSLDEDGYLTLHGRKKDLINRGGEKVWPAEIDAALMCHPAIVDAAAFGVPHSRLGEDVAAAVQLRPGAGATALELRTWLGERIAPFKVPRRIFILESIPKGRTGKLIRRQLGEMFGAAKPTTPAAPATSGDDTLTSRLLQVYERLLRYSPAGVDDDFFERGGDSLLAVALLRELEVLTGRKAPATILFEATTVRQLISKLSQPTRMELRPLVPLASKNNRCTLIYFHGDPSGGSYVRKLASALGEDISLFVVSPHGVDNEPIPLSIEAMAADRLPLIREAQPHGPYRLCGYCMGGLVAFEVARLLVAAGEQVELVGMIDPPTVNARPVVRALLKLLNHVHAVVNRRPKNGGALETAIAWTWYNIARLERFARFSPARRFSSLKERLQRLFGRGGSGLPEPRDLPPANPAADSGNGAGLPAAPFSNLLFGFFFWKYSAAMAKYFPSPLRVPAVYFQAEYDGFAWRRVSPDLEVVPLSGDHYAVLADPAEFANDVKARLRVKAPLHVNAALTPSLQETSVAG